MTDSTFPAFAREVARKHQLDALPPAVEKELLHYDILAALDASGWRRNTTPSQNESLADAGHLVPKGPPRNSARVGPFAPRGDALTGQGEPDRITSIRAPGPSR